MEALIVKIKTFIKRYKILSKPLYFLKRKYADIKKREIIAGYLCASGIKKLQLGCGGNILEGWLNTDLGTYDNKRSVRVDAAAKMPFRNDTFDFVYSEHLIEHLTCSDTRRMLSECHRILKAGGVIRISTPDLEFFVKEIYPDKENKYRWYIEFYRQAMFGNPQLFSTAVFINNMFRAWGHAFLYDFDTLKMILEEAGFEKVKQVEIQKSSHPELRGIEKHGSLCTTEELNAAESLVAEAVKGP